MAFNCRTFGYAGIAQIQHINAKQFSSDSLFVLEEPYLWKQMLLVNGANPPVFSPQKPDRSTLLRIEVPPNCMIRYEVLPPGRVATVGADSPSLTGKDQFFWGEGWGLSIADAAAFA